MFTNGQQAHKVPNKQESFDNKITMYLWLYRNITRTDRVATDCSERCRVVLCGMVASEPSSMSRCLATDGVNHSSVTRSLATRNANRMLIIHMSLSNKPCPKAAWQCCHIFLFNTDPVNLYSSIAYSVTNKRKRNWNINALRTVIIEISLTNIIIISMTGYCLYWYSVIPTWYTICVH
jgi:hypothetical protein